jgi:hypothetical protein
VSGKTPDTDPEPEAEPTTPATPDKSVSGAALALAGVIALTVTLVLSVIVAKNDGPAGPVAVITAIVVFACALPLVPRKL